jgi:hypothetical protein
MGRAERTTAVRRVSENLIRDHIENPPEWIDVNRQVRAIGALRGFWSPRTEEFVRGLLKRSGFLLMNRRPKPIRAAARTLLRTRK